MQSAAVQARTSANISRFKEIALNVGKFCGITVSLVGANLMTHLLTMPKTPVHGNITAFTPPPGHPKYVKMSSDAIETYVGSYVRTDSILSVSWCYTAPEN